MNYWYGDTKIATYIKKTVITLQPEWEPELERLKKDQFYNETQAEMFRYIISRGLEVLKKEKATKEKKWKGVYLTTRKYIVNRTPYKVLLWSKQMYPFNTVW